jgi:hypothetical protein
MFSELLLQFHMISICCYDGGTAAALARRAVLPLRAACRPCFMGLAPFCLPPFSDWATSDHPLVVCLPYRSTIAWHVPSLYEIALRLSSGTTCNTSLS